MIDLTCRHLRVNFATFDTAGRNYIATCKDCDWWRWHTPENPDPEQLTVSAVLDVWEHLATIEAQADNLTSPEGVAFAGRLFLAKTVNTAQGRQAVAAGLWVAVHLGTMRAVGTTSHECAAVYQEHRLWVVPPHMWDDAVNRLWTVREAEQRDQQP